MKSIMFIVVLLLISSLSYAQRSEKYRLPYNARCGIAANCYDCTDTLARFDGKLKKYISKNINWRVLEGITGIIVVELAVAENGAVCSHAIYNYTANENTLVEDLDLPTLIKHMPRWKPAYRNGLPVESVRTIALYSFVKGRPLFDAGYMKNNSKLSWKPARELEQVRKTIGTSEIDNNFDPD